MSTLALGIVLFAALFHAGWNYLTKKSIEKIVFVWWFLLVTLVIYLPMVVYFWPQTSLSVKGMACILGSALLHTIYFWTLSKAYEGGDLSLVYPIARGSMPLFVTVLAVLLIQEKLSVLGISGIILVVLGIYVIHLRSFAGRSFLEPFQALHGGASLWALSTGGSNGIGSLVDKVGVGSVYPPVYIYLMFTGVWLLLAPYILLKKRAELKTEWQANRNSILAVGFLVTFHLHDDSVCHAHESGELCGGGQKCEYSIFRFFWNPLAQGKTRRSKNNRGDPDNGRCDYHRFE